MRRASYVALGLAAALHGCGAQDEPAETVPPPEVALGSSSMPHGDHTARFGGTVWMHGDLHFEVVLSPDGKHQVYFSDASRMELPASVASEVTITVSRAGADAESLELRIDEFGESWQASGDAVADPQARALVRFVYEGEPYEIDVPFVAEPDPAADPHSMH